MPFIMRNVVYTLVALILLVACSDTAVGDEMILNGRVNGLKKGTIYLQKQLDSVLVSVDSATVNGSEVFSLHTDLTEPELLYLYLRLNTGEPINQRFSFFGEPGELEIATSLKKFGNEVVIAGSKNQKKLEDYRNLVKRYADRNLELIREQLLASQSGNDSLLSAKRSEQQRLLASKYLATVNFAMNNSGYEVSPFLMLTQVYDANLKYLDTVYNALPQSIRESKYGRELEQHIERRRKTNN